MARLMRPAALQTTQVVLPIVVLVAVSVFLGVLSGWPATAVWAVCAVGGGLGVYLLSAFRAGRTARPHWLLVGQAVVIVALAAASVIAAVTTYQRWIGGPADHQRDVQQVAAEASTVAGLLTTITNADRERYFQQLRPHVTDDVLQALKTNVVGVPGGAFTQTSDVTSVAVEIVNDGAATAIAVVRPTPPPRTTGVDSDPNDITLLLVLARYQDGWVVVNLAPLGVRPGYAHLTVN